MIFIALNSLKIREFQTFCTYNEHYIVGLQLATFYSCDYRNISKWDFVFSGTVSKLRKATVSFVMSVCLSAGNNLAASGRISTKLDNLMYEDFPKICQDFP